MTGSTMFDSMKRAWTDTLEARALRVLVVDDEDSVRTFVGRVMTEAGHQTVLAESGASAIAAAQKEGAFDILVTDLMMPNMNGDELARRMRQTQPGLKVLYLTGYSDSLFKEKATLWQDEAFLDKPCGVKGLIEAVSLLALGAIEKPPAPAAV